TAEELASVEAAIRAINPYAKLHRTERCALPIDQLLDRNAFDLDRILDIEPDFLESGHHHHHSDEVRSMSFTIPGDVDPEKFMPWINDVSQAQGPNILRSKGILAFKGEPRRFVFQGVHMILDGDLQRDWKAGETRSSRLVFIGRDLNENELRQGFEACAA
ncbi:MAG: cobalamin biosynthesis protein CobW, partial [Bosea sp. 32-68-6]